MASCLPVRRSSCWRRSSQEKGKAGRRTVKLTHYLLSPCASGQSAFRRPSSYLPCVYWISPVQSFQECLGLGVVQQSTDKL